MPARKRPFHEHYVVDANGCWLWGGSRRRYGTVKIGGVTRKAHRVSWEMAHGPIPEGLMVLHHCDVPACVNPDHLFIGTHLDNMADAVRKGRHKTPPPCPAEKRARGERNGMVKHPGLLCGEKNGRAKLTDEERSEIVDRRRSGESCEDVARRYGVHVSTIVRACRHFGKIQRVKTKRG